MRTSKFAANRTVRLVAACCMLSLLLAPAALAEGVPMERGSLVGPGAASAPLSFSPIPSSGLSGPRYDAQSAVGRFMFDGTGYTLILATGTPSATPGTSDRSRQPNAVRMQFEGADNATLVPSKLLPAVIEDSSGADSRSWRIGIPAYGVLTYQQLYSDIDLQYEGLPGRFKGTFYVLPGADPAQIRWRYAGAVSVEVGRESGELWVQLPGGGSNPSYLIEGAPLAWQEAGGRKSIVPARYEVGSNGVISYRFGPYDPSRVLVIDPVIAVQVSQ